MNWSRGINCPKGAPILIGRNALFCPYGGASCHISHKTSKAAKECSDYPILSFRVE